MNKTRKIFIAILLLSILVISGIFNYSRIPDFIIYSENPESNDGKEVSFSGNIISKTLGVSIIHDETNDINFTVHNVPQEWKIGNFVASKGIFHTDRSIDYTTGEIIWDRNIKLFLSIIGLTMTFIFIFSNRKKIILSI